MTTYKEIHSAFKLNGISFSFEDLKEVGYCLIKEGVPFEIPIGNFLIDWVNDLDTIEILTSGSTGTPKLIKLQKQHMVNSALATGSLFGLIPENTALLCLPSDYIAAKMMLVRAMVLGLHLDYVEPNSNPLENLDKSYDFGAMVPLQLQNSLSKINQIKTLIVGGAKLSAELETKIQNKTTVVFETYGMTETITHVAVKAVNHLKKSTNTNFKALPNVKFKIDTRNCLVIQAPDISDTEVITNDVVNLISDSEFEWIGRYDSIINSGGIKLIPEYIEAKLAEVIQQPYFVTGLPDEKLGEKLVLLVEGEINQKELLNTLKNLKTLDTYETPKEVFNLMSFVRTENGKIQRKKTLELI